MALGSNPIVVVCQKKKLKSICTWKWMQCVTTANRRYMMKHEAWISKKKVITRKIIDMKICSSPKTFMYNNHIPDWLFTSRILIHIVVFYIK